MNPSTRQEQDPFMGAAAAETRTGAGRACKYRFVGNAIARLVGPGPGPGPDADVDSLLYPTAIPRRHVAFGDGFSDDEEEEEEEEEGVREPLAKKQRLQKKGEPEGAGAGRVREGLGKVEVGQAQGVETPIEIHVDMGCELGLQPQDHAVSGWGGYWGHGNQEYEFQVPGTQGEAREHESMLWMPETQVGIQELEDMFLSLSREESEGPLAQTEQSQEAPGDIQGTQDGFRMPEMREEIRELEDASWVPEIQEDFQELKDMLLLALAQEERQAPQIQVEQSVMPEVLPEDAQEPEDEFRLPEVQAEIQVLQDGSPTPEIQEKRGLGGTLYVPEVQQESQKPEVRMEQISLPEVREKRIQEPETPVYPDQGNNETSLESSSVGSPDGKRRSKRCTNYTKVLGPEVVKEIDKRCEELEYFPEDYNDYNELLRRASASQKPPEATKKELEVREREKEFIRELLSMKLSGALGGKSQQPSEAPAHEQQGGDEMLLDRNLAEAPEKKKKKPEVPARKSLYRRCKNHGKPPEEGGTNSPTEGAKGPEAPPRRYPSRRRGKYDRLLGIRSPSPEEWASSQPLVRSPRRDSAEESSQETAARAAAYKPDYRKEPLPALEDSPEEKRRKLELCEREKEYIKSLVSMNLKGPLGEKSQQSGESPAREKQGSDKTLLGTSLAKDPKDESQAEPEVTVRKSPHRSYIDHDKLPEQEGINSIKEGGKAPEASAPPHQRNDKTLPATPTPTGPPEKPRKRPAVPATKYPPRDRGKYTLLGMRFPSPDLEEWSPYHLNAREPCRDYTNLLGQDVVDSIDKSQEPIATAREPGRNYNELLATFGESYPRSAEDTERARKELALRQRERELDRLLVTAAASAEKKKSRGPVVAGTASPLEPAEVAKTKDRDV